MPTVQTKPAQIMIIYELNTVNISEFTKLLALVQEMIVVTKSAFLGLVRCQVIRLRSKIINFTMFIRLDYFLRFGCLISVGVTGKIGLLSRSLKNVTTRSFILTSRSSSSSSSLKGIHSRPDTNRTGAEGLSFYYPRLLHCLDQMLAVMSLSHHRVLSSKTVIPRAPCGARCVRRAVSTWTEVCSEAPHSQFGEGARPHLCMDEWNRPTPVRRRLSLTQAARNKPIPTGLPPVSGTKAWSLEAFSQYSVFHLWFVHSEARMPNLERLSKRFRAAGTNGRLDLSLTWPVSEDPLKRPCKI